MPALAAVTLNTQVFNPSSIDSNGVATWYTAAGILDERYKLTMSVRQPKNGSNVARVTMKIALPIIDGVSGLKTAEALVTTEFVIPKTCSAGMRDELLLSMAGLLGLGVADSAVNDLEGVY